MNADLAGMRALSELNFSGYMLDRAILHEYDFNWKTFIEVYLEDYHVGPFHPGLGQFVTCDDLRWEFGRLQRANRGRSRQAWASPAPRCTSAGTTRC